MKARKREDRGLETRRFEQLISFLLVLTAISGLLMLVIGAATLLEDTWGGTDVTVAAWVTAILSSLAFLSLRRLRRKLSK
jgi:hypothetical protein